MVGSFDGTTFTPETAKLTGHRGSGFYAAQTFSDVPNSDGRRIQIGWFQTATPGMPFNQSMTIPLELKLAATSEGPRLTWTPVRELKSLWSRTWSFSDLEIKPGGPNPLAEAKPELLELEATFEPGEASEIIFNVRGASITYDTKKQELSVNDKRAPAPLSKGKQYLQIYCDRTALEVFASDGLTYIPMPFAHNSTDLTISVSAKGGNAKIGTLEVRQLKSAWE
jgi:sucrose-6-phosphate hydrolase SacC (GH32 family)